MNKKIVTPIVCFATISAFSIPYKKFRNLKKENMQLISQIKGLKNEKSKLQNDINNMNITMDSITKSYNNNCKILAERIDTFGRLSRGEAPNGGFKRTNINIIGTAYNLVEEINSKWRGGTATGVTLIGKDWTSRLIAVDPNVIPLRHYVYVVFSDKEYEKYNGWWYTADTGGKIKGHKVDFYLGNGNNVVKKTNDFGLRKAKILAIMQ